MSGQEPEPSEELVMVWVDELAELQEQQRERTAAIAAGLRRAWVPAGKSSALDLASMARADTVHFGVDVKALPAGPGGTLSPELEQRLHKLARLGRKSGPALSLDAIAEILRHEQREMAARLAPEGAAFRIAQRSDDAAQLVALFGPAPELDEPSAAAFARALAGAEQPLDETGQAAPAGPVQHETETDEQ